MNWLRFTQEQTTGVLKEHQVGTAPWDVGALR